MRGASARRFLDGGGGDESLEVGMRSEVKRKLESKGSLVRRSLY